MYTVQLGRAVWPDCGAGAALAYNVSWVLGRTSARASSSSNRPHLRHSWPDMPLALSVPLALSRAYVASVLYAMIIAPISMLTRLHSSRTSHRPATTH